MDNEQIMPRVPEREVMDMEGQAEAYASADLEQPNSAFVGRFLELAESGLPSESPFATVIDLGCGPADIPIRLARKCPHWRFLAVDASASMLRFAQSAIEREQLTDRVRLHLADITETHLATQSADAIISNTLLHHLPDPLPFWNEIKRLRGVATLVFVKDLFRPPNEEVVRALVDQHAAGGPKQFQDDFYNSLLAAFTPEEVRQQLDAVGLGDLKVRIVSDRHLEVCSR
ncbi:hypothetical protein Pan216_53650 [Planctomycetes bacterium Pan216]|uniref:Methyltransferase domain-containing protein n=1 Tax=Kolteria novifilia TaxID=2527975 RepID=A0A518BBW6_9BACT|nr:hypothetical protein Pan216_53650 [Planctomycetes bacterium Pan216]